jgi:DNA processing protein
MNEISIIKRADAAYPPLLARITDPPEQLYVRGNVALLSTRCFATIGSRDVSDYGTRAIKTIVSPLTQYFTIVSGMALGADSVAHAAALESKSPTIAVLGSGVDDDCVYPRSHISLAHRIIAGGGCVVSEYPPGEQPRPYYFPARNRIIAGLSVGVLIAEAARDSGTMITARLALDYNRDVFAVPGSIFSKLCAGTNELIQQGAYIATSPKDVLDFYGLTNQQQKLQLTLEQNQIYEIITKTSCTINELITLSNKNLPELMSIISELELLGVISRSSGKLSGGV